MTHIRTPAGVWTALAIAGSLAACGGDARPTGPGGESFDAPIATGPVSVSLRIVNLCTRPVDVYVGGDSAPLFRDVRPGAVTEYLAATLGGDVGVLNFRNAGDAADAAPVVASDVLEPASDKATMTLRGQPCSLLPLWEQFGDISTDTLRIRFVDATGTRTPIRLFMEQGDGSFLHVAAVESLGGSTAAGAVVPAVPPAGDTVRLQVGGELVASAQGFQVPAGVFRSGAKLFVFNRFSPGAALLIVGEAGPPPELPAVGSDPAGVVKSNPVVTIFNAIPDLCGSDSSHLVYRDGAGKTVAEVDAPFGRDSSPTVVPPAASGLTVQALPLAGCGAGGGGQVTTEPLVAGQRYAEIIFGSAAAATLQLAPLTGPPAGSSEPQLQLINMALGAPPLDMRIEAPGVDAGADAIVFSAIPFGGSSPWITSPNGARAVVVQRPSVAAQLGSQSYNVIAIGDWRPEATVTVELLVHVPRN